MYPRTFSYYIGTYWAIYGSAAGCIQNPTVDCVLTADHWIPRDLLWYREVTAKCCRYRFGPFFKVINKKWWLRMKIHLKRYVLKVIVYTITSSAYLQTSLEDTFAVKGNAYVIDLKLRRNDSSFITVNKLEFIMLSRTMDVKFRIF